ncbi:MAG: RidA family protein [Alphaproteobacteria bacterium]
MTIKRINPGPRLSGAVVHNGIVYVAGQVADDTSQDVKGQTEQVLRKIDGLLKEAGSDKSKILSANIWVSDMKIFNQMNAVWEGWVPRGATPARATVEAKLANPQLQVEIMCVAAV